MNEICLSNFWFIFDPSPSELNIYHFPEYTHSNVIQELTIRADRLTTWSSISAMISYNVVVGDTLSKVMVRIVPSWGNSMGVVRFGVVFFVTVFVITPLCLHKNISRLARASFLSLLCVVVILFAVICRMFSDTYDVV